MRLLESPDQNAALPPVGPGLIDAIQRSGLAGRGGAGFPTAVKWRAVAQRSRGDAVIVVNGAEGEPQSKKDRVLMGARPHLVLDGAFIAARVLRARRIVLYIGERHTAARDAMLRALAQRTEPERALVSMAAAPPRYVAGAEAADLPRAVLVGGYFGRWMKVEDALPMRLTPEAGIGCGVIGILPTSHCPVCETAAIMRYLAGESSAQCGPCFFGLRALAEASTR